MAAIDTVYGILWA